MFSDVGAQRLMMYRLKPKWCCSLHSQWCDVCQSLGVAKHHLRKQASLAKPTSLAEGKHHLPKANITCRRQTSFRPKRKDRKTVFSFWSEWQDLNLRPLDPQSSALPPALHPDLFALLTVIFARCTSDIVLCTVIYCLWQCDILASPKLWAGHPHP